MSNDDGKENDNLVFNIGDEVAGYRIIEKIDEGGFGQVFKVTKDSKKYAMKIESSAMEGGSAIKLEIDVLVDLQSRRVSNFPSFVAAGRREKYHYLVMELLGENLKSLRMKSSNPECLTPGTWTRLGIQCLYVVKLLHDNGFVHRDIKPANFAMGRADGGSVLRGRMVFLFDFGLARRFVLKIAKKETSVASDREKPSANERKTAASVDNNDGNPKGNKDLQSAEERKSGEGVASPAQYKFRLARPHTDFRGTQMYASLNAHNRQELGRADDISSLLYMLSEMTSPLPWAINEDEPVETQKKGVTFEQLFGIPQFSRIDDNLKSCNYYSVPDYDLIYTLFKSLLEKSGTAWNDPYDWETDQQPGYVRWKQEKLKVAAARSPYLWEDPKDFFKSDPWRMLARPKPLSKEREPKKSEGSTAKADRDSKDSREYGGAKDRDKEKESIKGKKAPPRPSSREVVGGPCNPPNETNVKPAPINVNNSAWGEVATSERPKQSTVKPSPISSKMPNSSKKKRKNGGTGQSQRAKHNVLKALAAGGKNGKK